MYGVNKLTFCANTVNLGDSYNTFLKSLFQQFFFKCKIEYQKKKKKKATQVFKNFGSVGKGHTNIFFWGGPHHGFNFHSQFFLTNPLPRSKMVGRHGSACMISNWLHQCRGGGTLNFFQVGVCNPDFQSVGLANWYLPLKEEACWLKISKFWAYELKIPNLGACELKISKYGGLRAKIWAKIEAVVQNFLKRGSCELTLTLANYRRGVKRGSSGPHIPIPPF